jgi:hypothetical protein
MDTERDENQNLKNDIDKGVNDFANANDTEDSIKENWYENDFAEDEDQEDTDYIDDQNNSNTGYTEKLLEKELERVPGSKDSDTEKESDIEDDPIVKNGIIIENENADESNSKDNENDEVSNLNS